MSYRNILRSGLLLSALAIGAVTHAQSFTWPFMAEFSDGSRSIGWNATGCEDGLYSVTRADGSVGLALFKEPASSYWSLGDCRSIVSWIQQSLASPDPLYRDVKLYSSQREAITRAHNACRLRSFTLPGADADLKESRGIEVEYIAASETRLLAHELAHTVQQSSKRQKAWLCSNFRLRIGDLPTDRVVRTEKFKVKQEFGPSQASKKSLVSEPWIPTQFTFYIPQSERKGYDNEAVKALDGNPTLFTVQLEYLDTDGLPMVTVRFRATVHAVGLADALADPADPDAKVKVVLSVNLSTVDDLNALIR